jgi:NIMA (never in mitosis gene a)-related kinase
MDEDSRVIIDDTCVSTDIHEIKQYKKVKLLGQGAYGKAYLVTSDDTEQI